MTDIYWPEILPNGLLADGFSMQPQSNILRTNMDAGAKKTRRRYTARTVNYNGKQIFDRLELDVFQQFYHNVLADGVLRFMFKDPLSDDEAEFRFTAEPTTTDAEGLFSVSMQMERLS